MGCTPNKQKKEELNDTKEECDLEVKEKNGQIPKLSLAA